MRVLLVTNDFSPKPGGIQQYLGGLVGALPGPVRVLAPFHSGATDEPGVERGHRSFMWPTPRTRRWVEGHIGDFGPDVVLFGAPHPLAQMGPRLRAATGVPFAVLCHGAEVTVPAAFPVVRSLLRHPLHRADVVFAVSEFTSREVERLAGREVCWVGSAADSRFSPADTPPSPPVLGCVSRFVPRKGQRRVLAAASRLRAEGRELSVLLVGTGRDERELRSLADRLRVPTRFEVGVPFEALPDLYREMTVFAMPCRSRWFGLEAEGLGVVFLEAAKSGLPVIAGDSGGAPETIEPGVTGFIATETEGIVAAVRTLLDDTSLARDMGEAGRLRALERFSWDAVAARFQEGFEAVAARRDP